MSVYTMQLRYIIENDDKLNLSNYPIFDENYRNVLNNKIIQHYYFNEIGLETPQLFNYHLGVLMNEIMPYFNQLYKSELLKINPLYNFSMLENVEKNVETVENAKNINTINSKNSNSSDDNTINVYSDTPNGMLSIGDIKTNTYASTASMDNSKNQTEISAQTSGEATTDNNIKTLDNYNKDTKGVTTSESELLLKYRETFLNIDMQVINELIPLFMGIF